MAELMKLTGILWLAAISVGSLCAQTIEVGGGAATAGIRISFLNAWSRNGFNTLVGDPKANVAAYGSAGLIQQFPAISGSGTLALVKADTRGFSLRARGGRTVNPEMPTIRQSSSNR